MTGGSNVPTTPSRADEQDFLPTTVTVMTPGLLVLTETVIDPVLARLSGLVHTRADEP